MSLVVFKKVLKKGLLLCFLNNMIYFMLFYIIMYEEIIKVIVGLVEVIDELKKG